MARRTNGANGTSGATTRDDRIHASATIEATPGAPDAGGAPAVRKRGSNRGAGANGSNGTHVDAVAGDQGARVVAPKRVRVGRDVEALERSVKRKVAVKSKGRRAASVVEDVEHVESETAARRKARRSRAEADESSAGSGYDSRDERAIANEVSERIRALLNEFGLDRLLRGASPKEMASGLVDWLGQLVPAARENALGSLKNLLASEYLQPDTWKGLLYMAQNAVEGARDARARRARGDYETDDFGFDQEFFESCIPVTRFLYEKWWRVEVSGLENVPDDKRSLIVANHSGILPFDGSMISQAIWSHHRRPRPVRWLYLKWFSSLPFVSILLSRAGGAMACPENGERLLEQDRLVGVFPEGLKGVGKLFKDRYKLARFGRGGFIKMAMRTRAPIIPVSVVGAEEIYPALTYLEFISKPLGMPMFPITPTFPWLGLLGLIPLPSKWSIHFGTPIRFNENAPGKVDDFLILSLLTEKVRGQIQAQIDDQLKLRKSVFFG